MEEWHYQRNGKTFGPISARQLLDLRQRSSVVDMTMVRRAADEAWTPLQDSGIKEVVPAPDAPAVEPPGYAPPKVALRPSVPGPHLSLWLSVFTALVVLITILFLRSMDFLTFAGLLTEESRATGTMPLPARWMLDVHETTRGFRDWLWLPQFLVVMTWHGCAFASLRNLYGDEMMRHGPPSCLWWITPFANLFMPFLCLREMRHLSRRRRMATQTRIPFGPLLWCMELVLLANFTLRAVLYSRTMGTSRFAYAGTIMDDTSQSIFAAHAASSALLALALIGVIACNLHHQSRLHRTWNA